MSNFAINNAYLEVHEGIKGLGILIFRSFIRPLALESAGIVGSALLYIFALPFESLIARYQRVYSFHRLESVEEDDLHKRLKPFYDNSCIFMYQVLQ